MQTNPFLGVILHSIGAFSSASCYTPQKQTKLWAWEIYWVTTASFAWLILPIAGAFLTIPNYLDVLATCPTDVMLRSLVLGIIYGVGGRHGTDGRRSGSPTLVGGVQAVL